MLPDDLAIINNPEPEVGSFAARLYEAMEFYAEHDQQLGWSLKTFVGAMGSMWQDMEDIVRDSEDAPGWSKALDLDNAPPEFLAFIAMFVGVRLRAGLSDEAQRDRIRSTDGMHRGTPAAFAAAAKQRLTGSKYVIINERQNGNPYRVAVRTLYNESLKDGPPLEWGEPVNIITNPKVHNDLTGWSGDETFDPLTRENADPPQGANWYVRHEEWDIDYNDVPLLPGSGILPDYLYLRATLRAAEGESVFIGVEWFDATDTMITANTFVPHTPAPDWTELVGIAAIPAGAVTVNIHLRASGAGTFLEATKLMAVTDPPGYTGAEVPDIPYFDGDTTDHQWTGIANASTSESPTFRGPSPQILADLLEQKPGGLVLDYGMIRESGVTHGDIAAAFDTYADIDARYATHWEMATELP